MNKSTIASVLKEKAFPLVNCIWTFPRSKENCTGKVFSFQPVQVREVQKHLSGLKRKKAVGLDKIPSTFLKDVSFIIAEPLTHIINLSLHKSLIPSDFKSARIITLFKSGSAKDVDNYRPISVLTSVSKILEKCVHTQILNYLEENKLLSIKQFGFRKQRSTELAATTFIDHIRKHMDKGEFTGAVYIDLSKAFDTISHSALLQKLPRFGISGTPKEWLTNYLFGRTQCVNFGDALSEPQPMFCGVPQGSILGPLLFLLHFNDSAGALIHCEIVKYADDTVLFVSHKSVDVIESWLNIDFRNFALWLQENELVVNLKKGKTEFTIFGTTKRLNNLKNPPMNVSYN